MSWLLSQALVEEYSGAICSGGKQSAQSKSNPTPLAYLQPDRMKAFSRLSRYGVTFEHLTADLGVAVLTSFLAAFPVRTSAKQGPAPVSMVNGPASGKNLSGLLAKYDPVTCSWKTAQCSLLEDLEQSLETWSRSGSMLNGVCYLQPMLAPLTYAKEYGSWPTPTCSDVYTGKLKSSQQKPGSMHSVTLPQAVAMRTYPTPASRDYRHPNKKSYQERGGGKKGEQLPNAVGGVLNPTWVEWLMGWPLGWTDLKPSETVKFRLPPPRRGGNSLNEQESSEVEA